MRYQNWDVLVFPDQSKIPLQEFKTACQVIQDQENHFSQANTQLLPTVTCFVPGLPADAPFRISIHSWQNPEVSRYVETLKKASDQIMFEARVFVDGRLVGSKWFTQVGPWPTVVDLGIDLDKQGEFEKLKFPAFHKELLSQSYWNAGDDLGRIKVIISEGFSRDNMTYPFERVKNVVSFSFQHAPLDVLEVSSIAWPNASMWRQVSLVGPYYTQQFSPRHATDVIDAHSHSPSHTNMRPKAAASSSNIGSMFPPPQPRLSKQAAFDPFTETLNPSFNGWRQPSSADVSMPDYSSSNSRGASRNITDPMILTEKQDRRFGSLQMPGAYDSLCEALMPSAPDNTPQNEAETPAVAHNPMVAGTAQAALKMETNPIVAETKSTGIEASIANTIKSRKEHVQPWPLTENVNTAENEEVPRKASLQIAIEFNGGNKRQRVITPAASKVIDDEDEPRSSPSLRKISERSTKQDPREGERSALGGIENL